MFVCLVDFGAAGMLTKYKSESGQARKCWLEGTLAGLLARCLFGTRMRAFPFTGPQDLDMLLHHYKQPYNGLHFLTKRDAFTSESTFGILPYKFPFVTNSRVQEHNHRGRGMNTPNTYMNNSTPVKMKRVQINPASYRKSSFSIAARKDKRQMIRPG